MDEAYLVYTVEYYDTGEVDHWLYPIHSDLDQTQTEVDAYVKASAQAGKPIRTVTRSTGSVQVQESSTDPSVRWV